MTYKEEYDDYSKNKAGYYLNLKFDSQTPWGYRNHVRERVVLSLAKNLRPRTLIDIGCASGHTLFEFRKMNQSVNLVGVDTGASFIDQATAFSKINDLNIEFHCQLAEEISDSKKFDCVICLEVLEHVSSDQSLMKTLLKLTEKYLIITVPNLNSDGTIWGRFCRLIKLRRFVPAYDFSTVGTINHGDQHVREYNYQLIKLLIEKSGFRIILGSGALIFDSPFYDVLYKVFRRIPLAIKIASSLECYISVKFPKILRYIGRHLVIVCTPN